MISTAGAVCKADWASCQAGGVPAQPTGRWLPSKAPPPGSAGPPPPPAPPSCSCALSLACASCAPLAPAGPARDAGGIPAGVLPSELPLHNRCGRAGPGLAHSRGSDALKASCACLLSSPHPIPLCRRCGTSASTSASPSPATALAAASSSAWRGVATGGHRGRVGAVAVGAAHGGGWKGCPAPPVAAASESLAGRQPAALLLWHSTASFMRTCCCLLLACPPHPTRCCCCCCPPQVCRGHTDRDASRAGHERPGVTRPVRLLCYHGVAARVGCKVACSAGVSACGVSTAGCAGQGRRVGHSAGDTFAQHWRHTAACSTGRPAAQPGISA